MIKLPLSNYKHVGTKSAVTEYSHLHTFISEFLHSFKASMLFKEKHSSQTQWIHSRYVAAVATYLDAVKIVDYSFSDFLDVTYMHVSLAYI